MMSEYSLAPEKIFHLFYSHMCIQGKYFLITMSDVIFHLYILEPNKTVIK